MFRPLQKTRRRTYLNDDLKPSSQTLLFCRALLRPLFQRFGPRRRVFSLARLAKSYSCLGKPGAVHSSGRPSQADQDLELQHDLPGTLTETRRAGVRKEGPWTLSMRYSRAFAPKTQITCRTDQTTATKSLSNSLTDGSRRDRPTVWRSRSRHISTSQIGTSVPGPGPDT
jgi:hypothetical protein